MILSSQRLACAQDLGSSRRHAPLIKSHGNSANREIRVAKAKNLRDEQADQSSVDTGAPTIKMVATHLRGFGIPFKINSDDDSFIEVQLYLSRDQGKHWEFFARQSTDQSEIPFQANEDGEYWFSLKTLNRDRRLIPEGDPEPELKIIVDTVKPRLDFRIGTDAAGRVICRWKAEDEHLAPQTLKILYHSIGANESTPQWHNVPVTFNTTARDGIYSDQIAWWPETNEQALNVVVEVADTAGNRIQVARQIVVPQSAWRHQNESTAQIADRANPNDAASNWAQPGSDSNFAFPPLPNIDQAATRQTAQAQKPAISPDLAHALPPNVVCEDGVCQVIPQASTNAVAAQPHRSPNRITRLVGSQVEYAAPPVPPGYVPDPALLPQQQPTPSRQTGQPIPKSSGSVVWQSEEEEWAPQSQSTTSSTIRIDPSLAPQPQSVAQSHTVPSTPSNPPTTTFQGNQSIGESSTQGATNQYRSPNSQGSRGIANTTLLPGVPTPQPAKGFTRPANASPTQQPFTRVGHAGTDTSEQQSVMKSPITTRTTNAPTQVIGSKRFQLNYGIDSIDPSGVARVELWLTRDQGRTWNAWGVDPDNQSPFPVVVEQEGHFGFRVVIHSKDGLTGQGPSSGDDADMWIQVDTQSPLTRITSVPYGRGNEAGRLVINYSVSDSFLTLRPITLAYSPASDGPWTLIEEGIRNDGRYVWQVATNIPQHIFLRIEAIDKAGNLGVHVLKQPIDVSGLVPRGTIHGVIPVGTRSPGG